MNKTSKIRGIIVAVIEGLALIGILLSFISAVYSYKDESMMDFSNGWTVQYHGKSYDNVNTNDFILPEKIQKGDTLTLINLVPKTIIDRHSIIISADLSAVQITANAQTIYSYGGSAVKQDKFVGAGVHIIQLPDDTADSVIRIIITAGQNGAFKSLPSIYLAQSDRAMTNYVNKIMNQIFVSIFLAVTGVIIEIMSYLEFFRGREWLRGFLIGMIAFLIGIWNMALSRGLQLFSSNISFNSFIEYLSLYAAIIPAEWLLFISHRIESRRRRNIALAALSVQIVFFVAALILHLTGIMYLPVLLPAFHIISITVLITVFIAAYKRFTDLTRDGKILYFGYYTMIFFCLLEMIRYYLMLNRIIKGDYRFASFLASGTLIFIFIEAFGLILYAYDKYMAESERAQLSQIAYTDVLTGLMNRAFCEMRFNEHDQTEEDCTMVSLDVNGLKKINDTYGHQEGDELLRKMSKILKESFSDIGDVIRMGGDEFLVISKYSPRIIRKRLRSMEEEETIVSHNAEYPVNSSYGMAVRHEVNEDARYGKGSMEKLYKLADSRMYEMKERSKNS